MVKKLFASLVLAVMGFAQSGTMEVGTLADITGDAAAHQLSSTAIDAKWVIIIALTANGAAVRIGDANTSVSRGAAVAAGGGLTLPLLTPMQPRNAYDLSKIYYYAASGDKISVLYGK